MRRLFVLTKNEFTKIFAKKFVWILSVIAIVFILLTGVLMSLLSLISSIPEAYEDDYIRDDYEYYERVYEECSFDNVNQKSYYAYYYCQYSAKLEILESDPSGVPTYKRDMYEELCTMITAVKLQELYDSVVAEQGYDYAQEMFADYEHYLSYDKTQIEVFRQEYMEIDTYEAYLEYLKDSVETNDLTEAQKNIEYKAIEYHEKLNPDGNDSTVAAQIDRYRYLAYSLEDGYDYIQDLCVLATDVRAEYERELALCEKTFDRGIVQSENATASELVAVTMIDTTQSFLVILLVIVSGSMISGEISSGSIKSLIISPVKRYKIILSKFIAVAVTGLALTLISYCLTVAYTFVFHGGFDSLYPYVTSSAIIIPRVIYLLIRFLIAYGEAMVLALFAFMLSTLTKNTAISVALPFLINMIGSTVTGIMSIFPGHVNSAILKVLPFNHFDISQRLFPSSSLDFGAAIEDVLFSSGAQSPAWFSVIYLLVLTVGMAFTALDSFKNKDILK